jgi:hypothetical protein
LLFPCARLIQIWTLELHLINTKRPDGHRREDAPSPLHACPCTPDKLAAMDTNHLSMLTIKYGDSLGLEELMTGFPYRGGNVARAHHPTVTPHTLTKSPPAAACD